ncbi:yemanuclein [Topomyia yanbarensis]|uniref:yemanuclein n=1 Tax=Topomyia yanbarensis TaxID=2498891 RepID=UPI00273AD8FF|nr:yemanuclein [Topomyia yanbarensis]
MSEMKRVTLTTIGDVVKKSPFGGSGFDQNTDDFFSGALAGGVGAGPSSKNGSGTKPRKTIRLELELFEPTAKSFPEFNYSNLAREEQKRQRKLEKKATTNGFLSEQDDNDDVARIARELEKKYGSGTAYSSSGKFARPSKLDYCDRGAGYDEEDSFIDNTEAYDELIPQEVETVGGGFYINSGQLEFKTLSNFERPEDAIRMPKPKKRLLSSSSDSSGPEVKVAPKTKKKDERGSGTSGAESASKSGKVGRKRLNGHVTKKAKVAGEKPNRKVATHKEGKKKKDTKESTTVGPGAGTDLKVVKTTTVKDMLRAKRDSLRKMEQEKKGKSSGSVSSSEAEEVGEGDDGEDDGDDTDQSSDASDSDSSGSGSDDSDSDTTSETDQGAKLISEEEAKKRDEIKLPDNLPDHLLQDLNSLKDIAKNTKGRLNFFDATVADLLLQIDVSSRMCGGSARNSVYKHLESHLRVSRQTLMVKIKKIRIRKEDNKVKKAIGILEDAVTEMMPKLIANYEAEKQKAHDLRTAHSASSDTGEKPEIKHPKKKFPWNDHLRSLLNDVVTIRKKSFHILRPRKETEEGYVQSYLAKQVVSLWPSGWIRYEDLQKELDRRKKTEIKATSKEVKKTVSLPTSTTPVPTQTVIVNGPSSKPETVLSFTAKPSKSEEKKIVRPPLCSPVASTSMSQPSPSTSPAGLKRTSDHSIINIISSPPSKSSSHSSHLLPHQQQQQQQPPRPQSQPPRPTSNFDEDLIQTHVINLETGHNAVKNSPHTSTAAMDFVPKDLRVNSPALSSASSASSSRRQSSYQDPPNAHTTPVLAPTSSNRKSRDEDSDSSIEIIGEYNVADKYTPSMEKKVDPLNLAMPALNKDKYKKSGNSSKTNSRQGSGSGSSPGMGTSTMNINNNLDKKKYGAPTATTTVGGFVLPSMAGLMQDLKSSTSIPPKMVSIPGDLDVIRIMKELQELQAIQMNSMNKTAGRTESPKPAHSFSTSTTKKPETSNHQNQSRPTASQHPQQSHHKVPDVNMNGSSGAHAKVLNPASAALKKAAQQ